MADDDFPLIDLDYVPGKTTFEIWQEFAARDELEGKAGFTFWAFSSQLALLQRWVEGDARAFDLVKQAVMRWEETGEIPPSLDWKYWELTRNYLPS